MTRRLAGAVVHTLAWLTLAWFAGGCSSGNGVEPQAEPAIVAAAADRSRPPTAADHVLAPASQQPPPPVGWAAGQGPVRTNAWWTALASSPANATVWAQPLVVRFDATSMTVGLAEPLAHHDGSASSQYRPLWFFDHGETATVVDADLLSVALRWDDGPTARIGQLDPSVHFSASEPVTIRVPGAGANTRTHTDPLRLVVDTRTEAVVVVAARSGPLTRSGDLITAPAGPVTVSILADDPDLIAAAGPTCHATVTERLDVAADGTVTQLLQGVGSRLWAAPNRFDLPAGSPTLPSSNGAMRLVVDTHLSATYAPVDVRWDMHDVGLDQLDGGIAALAEPAVGSYFGAKYAFAAAQLAHLAHHAGDPSTSGAATAIAKQALVALADPVELPVLRWDPTWGSVVIEPAEFGAATELNDHQLQYGYWVAAASYLVELDPSLLDGASGARLRATIELLIADYAGTAPLDNGPDQLPTERTWSPADGHSWANGVTAFDAGNNLESISESSFAWWAAARWFRTTGQEPTANEFVARFVIETHAGAERWLPTDPNHHGRPWSGVVWSSKSDLGTWFDPSPAAALGIRLLPISPASFARYSTSDAVPAAERRWRWCAEMGPCDGLWPNLLATDALVAGATPPSLGPDEPSTHPAVVQWWSAAWPQTTARTD